MLPSTPVVRLCSRPLLWSALVLLAGSGCTFDRSGNAHVTDGSADREVPPGCGDGVRDDGDGEICDGADLGDQTCLGLGYTGGVLACTASCTLDESLCEIPEDCGNGIVDVDEACDGADLAGETCASVTGHTSGELTCHSSCQLDPSACHTCGDGSIDGPEHCDGANLNGQSCTGLGHLWGDLTCAPDCRLDDTGCRNYPANWFDLSCPYRKAIAIDPAHVDAPLVSFPVLVHLTDTDLRDHAGSSGNDLHFATESGGQPLNHELESYDGATGELVAWVGVDLVSDTTPTVIYLYYGDSGCGQSVDPLAVWDSDHHGVWHLAELSTAPRLDSTTHGAHATTASYDGDEATQGHIDGADHLDGIDDHLLLPESVTNGLWDFTLCFWIKTTESRTNATGWQNPTLIGNISNNWDSGDFGILTEGGIIGLRSGLCSTSDERNMSTIAINDDQWHHVCAVCQGATISLWVDSLYAAEVCAGGRAMLPPGFWVSGHSGESTATRGDYHQGVFDELRISGVARSAAWRNASYTNQLAPSSFYVLSPEEALP